MKEDFLEQFKKELLGCRAVAITGSYKNVGKTTTLNFIIRLLSGSEIGITSVGRDGEQIDAITKTSKPRIYIGGGAVVATAKSCLLESDASFEILDMSGIGTPVGEIVIAKSKSPGFVELAGPSISQQLTAVCKKMCYYGAAPVLIDGALSRKTFALPETADACVYCTGGALSCNVGTLIKKTLHELALLSVKEADAKTAALFDMTMNEASVAFCYSDRIEKSSAKTSIGAEKEVVGRWTDDLQAVFIKGALTDRFISGIMDSRVNVKKVRFVAEDGTKLLLTEPVFRRFILSGGRLFVRKGIRIIGVSVNPVSPDGGRLDFETFKSVLEKDTQIPIFNAKNLWPDVIE